MSKVSFLLKKILLLIFLLIISYSLFAQGGDSLDYKVYKINFHIDMPVTVLATGTSLLGLATVNKKSPLDSLSIIALDANDVNGFDRSATRQDA